MSSASNVCEICKSEPFRYTCPRCNITYCSTGCYQSESHSDCSETFYKDCVDEMLATMGSADPENRKRTEELLYRANNLDEHLLDSDDEDDEVEDVESLEERMNGIDLDDSPSVWDKLTEREKKEYFEFLKSGDLKGMEFLFPEPFWMRRIEGKVVAVDELIELKKSCPELIKIKDFKKLSKSPPAECLKHNLIDIVASYAFTFRYFAGDFSNEPEQAVSCIINVSSVLKSNAKHQKYEEALKSIIYNFKNVNWIETSDENEKLLNSDLESILRGPHLTETNFYILCCLSDLSKLLKSTLKPNNNHKKVKPDFETPSESIENIKKYIRKIDFYLSYVKDIYSNDFCK